MRRRTLENLIQNHGRAPIIVVDHSRFYFGFLLGALVALAGLLWGLNQVGEGGFGSSRVVQAAMVGGVAASPLTELAIARAEQINVAAAAYVENCGGKLARQAWDEAGNSEERYQLLTSFIRFAPESLHEYMPERFELVLWDDIESAATSDKVGLLAGGSAMEY